MSWIVYEIYVSGLGGSTKSTHTTRAEAISAAEGYRTEQANLPDPAMPRSKALQIEHDGLTAGKLIAIDRTREFPTGAGHRIVANAMRKIDRKYVVIPDSQLIASREDIQSLLSAHE